MGLTTSCEAIERQANPTANEPEPEASSSKDPVPIPPVVSKAAATERKRIANGTASITPASKGAKRKPVGRSVPPKKKTRPKQPKTASSGKKSPRSKPSTPKATPKKASQKKGTPAKGVKRLAKTSSGQVGTVAVAPASAPASVPAPAPAPTPTPPTVSPPMNSHRARIAVGKRALAAIQEGTRIYIKSGEGNGGATWWDSGVIQKIHERGKPYEVQWQGLNNRGEEVDTDVEKRILLPVTYSLAGVAAEAIAGAESGTYAAAIARKDVLTEARIGSWCIKHPEEPWGMLDPFGEDSSAVFEMDVNCT